MANISRGFTPRESAVTPSNKKFTFKKPGSLPLANDVPNVTPCLPTDNIGGSLSTENPCSSFEPSSCTDDELDFGEADTVVPTLRSKTSSGPVTKHSDKCEGVTKYDKRESPKGSQIQNKLICRGKMPHEISHFNEETPMVFATSKQNIDSGPVTKKTVYRPNRIDKEQQAKLANPVSSSYFSKSSSSNDPIANKKSRSKSRQRPVSSVMSGCPSTSSLGGNSSAVTESGVGDTMSIEDVGHLRTVERPDNFSMSLENQIYMGVMWHSGKLSVAYYDLDTTVVNMMLDITESDEFKLLHRVIKQVNPTQIILSSKQDERLVKTLKSYDTSMTEGSIDQGPCQLQFLPSIDFALEICKRRVLSLELPSVPQHYTDTERTLYFNSLVPFENVCMVRALGGLLKYLEKMRVGIELEEAGVRVPVLDLKVFTLDNQMILDETAYSALQIFQKEAHPSAYKVGTSNSGKEGLSLFGIMNRTKSQIGSRMLRVWFQRPLKDLEMLKKRHDAISFFVNSRNMEVVKTLEDSVKHVKNISKILTRMMQSQASVGDWQALYKTVYNASNIKEVCRVQPQSVEIFRKITEKFSDELHTITTLLTKIVDFPESLQQSRFVVKSNVDAELDRKKRTYSGLPDFMTQVADTELKRLGEEISECSVLYMPQIGYLLAIPETAVNTTLTAENNYHIEGLQFLFSSNNMLHYRSACTRELDMMFGDTRNDITDIETSIMHKLQNTVLEHTHVLMAVLDYTAELDCLLSLATCAREYDYVRPSLTLDNVIEVTGGRHAIQEMCCGTFVPNDILSNGEYGKIKVLTGPNACGKSVYLKQVAVIIFLAQVGSFVPAESATLGLMDRIYTRVRSLESISTGLSTFMIDINQMAEAMRSATEKSLCIIDEFGKGTDMIDGLSLLCSCLSYWVSQDSCPHVFVSTHFHSIIHQHLLPKSQSIKYLTLETLHNGEELVFLYQLIEGHTSSSFACHVAAQVGLPQEVVKRGIEVSELIRQCKPIHRADTAGTETQFKRCSTLVNRFLELDLETVDIKSFFSEFVLPTADME